jgi:hypothetical protein
MPDVPRTPYLLDMGNHRELVDLLYRAGGDAVVVHKGRRIKVSRKQLERFNKRHVLPE